MEPQELKFIPAYNICFDQFIFIFLFRGNSFIFICSCVRSMESARKLQKEKQPRCQESSAQQPNQQESSRLGGPTPQFRGVYETRMGLRGAYGIITRLILVL